MNWDKDMYFSNEDFINELDSFFAKEDMPGAEKCLLRWKGIAERGGNTGAVITVLNESVGFYRNTGDKEKALSAVNEINEYIRIYKGLNERKYAVILINCATTLSSFGENEKALSYYNKAEEIFNKSKESDFQAVASFCNNKALCLQKLKKYDEAIKLFEKALSIDKDNDGLILEYAVTCVNIACLYEEMEYDFTEIEKMLDAAMSVLKNKRNFSLAKYAFTCRKCAPAYGHFGFFLDELFLNRQADRYYENNRLL